MKDLEQARGIIDRVDKEIARLYCERMEAVRCVARYKQERGIPILDEGRERMVIERNAGRVEDEILRGFYIRFLQDMMKNSRDYQRHLLEEAWVDADDARGGAPLPGDKSCVPAEPMENGRSRGE